MRGRSPRKRGGGGRAQKTRDSDAERERERERERDKRVEREMRGLVGGDMYTPNIYEIKYVWEKKKLRRRRSFAFGQRRPDATHE